MSARVARFEIVHNPGERQPWWARYVAGNGRIRWTTETYVRRSAAVASIEDLCVGSLTLGVDGRYRIVHGSLVLEVREVEG